jgi:benzodiazapine receptor
VVTTSKLRNISLIFGFIVLATYAIGSGFWVNTGDNWYRSLNAPSWQPPDFIFGLIWPYNFFVIGVSIYTNSQKLSNRTWFIWLALLTISVICGLIWSYQFYKPHNLMLAAIFLSCAAVITIPISILNFSVSTKTALAFLPYQIWVLLASSLSWGYYFLNQK